MRKNIYKKEYGFSLIETLIAVSILMIAIVGPLSLVQAGLFSSIHQRNQVTAMYLAQEAMEYVKNIRDTNAYEYNSGDDPGRGWLDVSGGQTLFSVCAIGCYVDPHGQLAGGNFVENKTSNLSGPYLQQNTDGSNFIYYSYGTTNSTPTTFTRVVKISAINYEGSLPIEASVSVTVGWKDNALDRSYTVSENIYNYEQ